MADSASGRGRSGKLIPALAVTGVLTYFLEPEKGARRRADASRRVSALLGRSKETVADATEEGQVQLTAIAESGTSPAPPTPAPSSGVDAPPASGDAVTRARERNALSGGGLGEPASS